MGFLDKLFGKKQKTKLPKEITDVFDKVAEQNAMFETMKKMMGIDFSKTKVDGSTNSNYGLVPENPIFVKGPIGTQFYLSRLVASDGSTLKWERRGSIQTPNVSGNTDIYDGLSPEGSKVTTIYLNWYGNSNSDVAPQGLLLK